MYEKGIPGFCTKLRDALKREKFLEEWKKHNKIAENTHQQAHTINKDMHIRGNENNDDGDNDQNKTEEMEQEEIEKKNEDAERELEHLMKKTQDTSGKENEEEISKRYPMNAFYKQKSRGDGYCIIHSVIKCLRHIGRTVSSKDKLLDDLHEELTTNIDIQTVNKHQGN